MNHLSAPLIPATSLGKQVNAFGVAPTARLTNIRFKRLPKPTPRRTFTVEDPDLYPLVGYIAQGRTIYRVWPDGRIEEDRSATLETLLAAVAAGRLREDA